jgi:G3E family GTPase
MRRVAATVITGVLGAGKTSLVRHLLARAQGRRLAVLVDEFGELGIDRRLLLGCGDEACPEGDIVELADGCPCCTVAMRSSLHDLSAVHDHDDFDSFVVTLRAVGSDPAFIARLRRSPSTEYRG